MGALEKKNYQAVARDLKQPIEEIVLAAKAIQALENASASTKRSAITTARRASCAGP